MVGHEGREQRHQHGGDGAGHERADGRRGQRRAGAAALGHLEAFERGDHGAGLARRIQQDRGGRSAVHRAVVDAGEEDHAGRGLHLRGDRQQHRHRHRRAQPGQHADRGAHRAADEGPQQVDRRAGGGKAAEQRVPGVHHRECLTDSQPAGARQARQVDAQQPW